MNLIKSAGAWCTLIDPETGELLEDKKFNGKSKTIEYFKNNAEEYSKLWEIVNEKLSERRKE